jgi:hypothetical protein
MSALVLGLVEGDAAEEAGGDDVIGVDVVADEGDGATGNGLDLGHGNFLGM